MNQITNKLIGFVLTVLVVGIVAESGVFLKPTANAGMSFSVTITYPTTGTFTNKSFILTAETYSSGENRANCSYELDSDGNDVAMNTDDGYSHNAGLFDLSMGDHTAVVTCEELYLTKGMDFLIPVAYATMIPTDTDTTTFHVVGTGSGTTVTGSGSTANTGGSTSCNTGCGTEGTLCGDGTTCMYTQGSFTCRNPQCSDRNDCSCVKEETPPACLTKDCAPSQNQNENSMKNGGEQVENTNVNEDNTNKNAETGSANENKNGNGIVPSANNNSSSSRQCTNNSGATENDTATLLRTFKDIPSTHWAVGYIAKAVQAGYIDGNRLKKIFSPNSNITRGEYAKVLSKIFNESLLTVTSNPFTDVSKSSQYAPYILILKNHGIGGFPDGTFHPNDPIGRADAMMALIAMGGVNVSGVNVDSMPFSDILKDAPYAKAIMWAYNNCIVNGRTLTLFVPNDNITRAEVSKIAVLVKMALGL